MLFFDYTKAEKVVNGSARNFFPNSRRHFGIDSYQPGTPPVLSGTLEEELFRHTGESRYPSSSSAEQTWIPADAGMTEVWKSTLSRLE